MSYSLSGVHSDRYDFRRREIIERIVSSLQVSGLSADGTYVVSRRQDVGEKGLAT